jgi:hypothetical protein
MREATAIAVASWKNSQTLATIVSRAKTLLECRSPLMPRFGARGVENDAGEKDAEKNDQQDIRKSAKPAAPGEKIAWNCCPTKTEKSSWMTDSSAHVETPRIDKVLKQEPSGESGKREEWWVFRAGG